MLDIIDDLFAGETTFTEFEVVLAEQVAIARGRVKPTKEDMVFAVEKTRQWNERRAKYGLTPWGGSVAPLAIQ